MYSHLVTDADTVDVDEVMETEVAGAVGLQEVAERAAQTSAETNACLEDRLRKGATVPGGFGYDWKTKKFFRKKAPGRAEPAKELSAHSG